MVFCCLSFLLIFLPVLRSCFSAFCSYLYLFLTFVVSMYRKLLIFCKSVLYPVLFFVFVFVFFFLGCSPYGLSLPLSSLQVGIPCCLLLYSILANFLKNKMTNWDQMNIPSDLKSFMREFIHELGMLHTHITCLLISSKIPLSSSDARATCHTRPGSDRRSNQSIITTSVTQAWTYIDDHCPLDWLPSSDKIKKWNFLKRQF